MSFGKANPKWQEKVLAWQASGKTVKSWCLENQVPITTFYGWRNRQKKMVGNKIQTTHAIAAQSSKASHEFIELKDKKPFDVGITLECSGVKIYLSPKFDSFTLKQCITCLRGVSC